MRKPLSGKAWFEAQGRRAQSRGLPLNHKRQEHQCWPMWARSAWARGWIFQQSSRQLSDFLASTKGESNG